MTQERSVRQAQAEAVTVTVLEGVDQSRVDALRRHLQVESKDRRGQKSLKYKFFMKASTMEALLACGDDKVVAALILEALTNNVRLEDDAQATLCEASASIRLTVAEAMLVESKRLYGDADEHKQARAKFMYGLAKRLQSVRAPRQTRMRPEREPKPLLDDIVQLALAAGDLVDAAVAMVEAPYVDSDVRDMLFGYASAQPLEQVELFAETIKVAAETKDRRAQDFFCYLTNALVKAAIEQSERREARDAATRAA